jgi:hypothetical protein
LKSRNNEERSLSKGVTLKDLCPEDKAKIGDLVKKLASQTKETKETTSRFERSLSEAKLQLRSVQEQHQEKERENSNLKDKFS